jgi:diaminopimelate decarboxylase/aspartate kinase
MRNWIDTADYFVSLLEQFPLVRVFDLGGGIGVPDRAGAADFDMAALDAAMRQVRERAPGVELWLEPGRIRDRRGGGAAREGHAAQGQGRGVSAYVGVATGMEFLDPPGVVRRPPRRAQSEPSG